jgi:hydroxymethylglutaryl-CoA lyase
MAGWIRALSTYKPPETVIGVVERLVDIGVDEVSVSDTIGTASPDELRKLLDHLLPMIPSERIGIRIISHYS